MERTVKSRRIWKRDQGLFMTRREAPSIAIRISTSCSCWRPFMWWWPSPTGSTMKVPTLKPSSVGAGPSSGWRWPPAGCVCCCTCARWLRPSAVPLGSSMCEDLSNPLGSAGWKWHPLNKSPKTLSNGWRFAKSWHPLAGLSVWKGF